MAQSGDQQVREQFGENEYGNRSLAGVFMRSDLPERTSFDKREDDEVILRRGAISVSIEDKYGSWLEVKRLHQNQHGKRVTHGPLRYGIELTEKVKNVSLELLTQ